MKQWKWAAVAASCAVVLAGCGGASDGSNTTPKSVVSSVKVFGDSIMDSGAFGYKFTIQSADAANPFLIFPEVVAANFNCPGQVVISGSIQGVELAGEKLKEAGAKRVLLLPVGGAFHSPFMEPARLELAAAIEAAKIDRPICPIFQNVNAKASQNEVEIKANLIAQLTGPVRWTQSIEAMVSAGAIEFIECGPGKVLQGLVRKINAEAMVSSMELIS